MSYRNSYVSEFCYDAATLGRALKFLQETFSGPWAPFQIGDSIIAGIHKNLCGTSGDWDNCMMQMADALEDGDSIIIVSIFETGEVKHYKFADRAVVASVIVPCPDYTD
jgi:hypothetical protein